MAVISFSTAPSGKTWIFTGQIWNLATYGYINDIPIPIQRND
jgi:hypothetical protein